MVKENFTKYALSPCFIHYASKVEEQFAEYLDKSEKVIWWYKNGEGYGKYLGILYHDIEGKPRTFYPDFIIKTGEKIWIIDTKSGYTDEQAQVSGKRDALTQWLETQPHCAGGIVVRDKEDWKIWHNTKQKEALAEHTVGEAGMRYDVRRILEL